MENSKFFRHNKIKTFTFVIQGNFSLLPTARSRREETTYWDDLLADESWLLEQQAEWLLFTRQMYASWVRDYMRGGGNRVFKTDCFEELRGGEVIEALQERFERVVVGDVAYNALRRGAWQMGPDAGGWVQAPVQELPFRDGAFDGVVSFSTLDHFESVDEIDSSLCELSRLTKSGGQLLLTLDNGANPVVWLRNRLPQQALEAASISPYRYGRTLGPKRLRRALQRSGWEVKQLTAVLHSPRVLAVAASSRVGESRVISRKTYHAALKNFEGLSNWPTRMLSGYFLLAVAEKR